MQTNITLTHDELTNIIEQTVEITLKKIMKKNQTETSHRVLSRNEARSRLRIGYTKLNTWIKEGKIREINGMIPESEINRILNN